MTFCRKHIGRSARPAIEIFVAASDCKIRFRSVQIDFNRAGAVAQIPNHQRAHLMRAGGHFGHIAHAPGFVVNLREQHDRDILVEFFEHIIRINRKVRDCSAAEPGDALHHVTVGREVG